MSRTLPLLGLLLSVACGAVEETPSDAALSPDAASLEPDAPPAPEADAAIPTSNAPGKHLHTLTVDGMTREVIVYVPESASGPTAVPAVLVFHGTSGDGERFYTISGWREKSDEVGLISVYPSALVHCLFEDENGDLDFEDPGERKVTTKWADGKLGDADRMPLCTADDLAELSAENRALADHPMADDLHFTQAILDLLAASYAVDARRVYATGFSNGGNFTSRLAVEMSDRFAAIAASGGLLQAPVLASRGIPVAFTVGELDDRFTVPMGVAAIPLDEEDLLALPGWKPLTITRFLDALQIDDSYVYDERTLNGGKKAVRFSYLTSDRGPPNSYFHVVIQDLGHQYANGTNHPVVYADMFWEFFQVNALP